MSQIIRANQQRAALAAARSGQSAAQLARNSTRLAQVARRADAVGNRMGDSVLVARARMDQLFDTATRAGAQLEVYRARLVELRRKALRMRRVLQAAIVQYRQLEGLVGGLTRRSRRLELLEQRALARAEMRATNSVSRSANRRFAISQLPQRVAARVV